MFDRNGNSDEDLSKAEALAKKNGYNIAFSNPTFEIWFLLHFTDQQAYLADSDAVISKLRNKDCIPNYNKSGNYYDMLLPRRLQAVDRSLALQKRHTDNGLPLLHRVSNPCTTVAGLVELLHNRAERN